MNLYEISKETQAKIELLGEMCLSGQEPSQEFVTELLAIKGELDKKLINYGFVVKQIGVEIDSVDAEIKRLTALKNAKKRTVEILKNRMEMAMKENEMTKIDDPILPIRLQNNQKAVVLDIDPVHLPKEFQKVEISANKIALKKALDDGQEIKGVRLEQSQSIRIG